MKNADSSPQDARVEPSSVKTLAHRLKALQQRGELSLGAGQLAHHQALHLAARLSGYRDYAEVSHLLGKHAPTPKKNLPLTENGGTVEGGPKQGGTQQGSTKSGKITRLERLASQLPLEGQLLRIEEEGGAFKLSPAPWETPWIISSKQSEGDKRDEFVLAWGLNEALQGRAAIVEFKPEALKGLEELLQGAVNVARARGLKLRLIGTDPFLTQFPEWRIPAWKLYSKNLAQAREHAQNLMSPLHEGPGAFYRKLEQRLLALILLSLSDTLSHTVSHTLSQSQQARREAEVEMEMLQSVKTLISQGWSAVQEKITGLDLEEEDLLNIRGEMATGMMASILNHLGALPGQNLGGNHALKMIDEDEMLSPGLGIIVPSHAKAKTWAWNLRHVARGHTDQVPLSFAFPTLSEMLESDTELGKKARMLGYTTDQRQLHHLLSL